jgi:hypothetical protein
MGSDAAPLLAALPAATVVDREIASERQDRIAFDTGDVRAWDSALVVFSARTVAIARTVGVTVDGGGFPRGVIVLVIVACGTFAVVFYRLRL